VSMGSLMQQARAEFDAVKGTPELEALKAYVTAPGTAGGARQSETTVLLTITHCNLGARFLELRFDLHSSIDNVKSKLYQHTGTAPQSMVLQLKDPSGALMCVMDDGARPLGFYSPLDGYVLHVIDTDPHSLSARGGLEDVSQVEKYVMSDDDYNNRENTYRKFKEEKLRKDPTWTLQKEMAERRGVPVPEPTDPDAYVEEAKACTVDSRCEVSPGGKRGVVRFVGKDLKGMPPGWWIGVQYDEPVGKNDGSVKGERYFECPQGYGGFIRPDKVQCGDFPNLDDELFASDDDEI